MKLICPKCKVTIEAKNINIQQMVGVCEACNEIVQIDSSINVTSKPPESALQEIKMIDNSIGLLFPKNKSIGLFFIVFGGFWDLISGFILFFIFFQEDKLDFSALIFVSLFFLSGLIIALVGVALVNMSTTIYIDKNNIKRVRKTFGKEFIKKIENNSSVMVERVVRYSKNEIPIYGAKIRNSKNESITVGVGLTEMEVGWIRHLIESKSRSGFR